MIWVAVDAMAGDYAPRHAVDGALAAARHFDLGVALVGLPALREPELLRHPDRDSTITLRVGSLLARRALRRFRRRVDYSEYGGAPLLGAAGVTIVGHGRSNPLAVRNAVVRAYRFASDGFIQRVEQEIAAVAAA